MLGSASCALSRDRRSSSSSSKNGFSIVESFGRIDSVMVRPIELTRSECFSAARTLSSSSGAGGSRVEDPPYCTMIGSVGQQSKAFETGVPCLQRS